MPYTLLKFALWFGLAALIGGVIGWSLRSLRARTESTLRRSTAQPYDRKSPTESADEPRE